MLQNITPSLNIFFGCTTLVCLFLVHKILKSSLKTHRYSLNISMGFVVWMSIQAALTLSGFYANKPNSFPPKIVLFGILPMMVLTISLLIITYLHIVRIPVEIALYWLFLQKAIPEIMTFEGRNFDILAGISAPLMVYFYKKGMNPKLLIAWNIMALILLVNIVFTAIFSTETPLQKFGFEQPNIAIIHFPFSWLATFIVPAVLFSHLATLRILLKKA
jgi:hypothetical protein